MWVRGRKEALEGFVMRAVIGLKSSTQVGGLRGADCLRGASGLGRRRFESSLEPSPRNSGSIQQVTDVKGCRSKADLIRAPAIVIQGVGIIDHSRFTPGGNSVAGDVADRRDYAAGLAGNEVQGARRGRPEHRVERVIAHGEVLGSRAPSRCCRHSSP